MERTAHDPIPGAPCKPGKIKALRRFDSTFRIRFRVSPVMTASILLRVIPTILNPRETFNSISRPAHLDKPIKQNHTRILVELQYILDREEKRMRPERSSCIVELRHQPRKEFKPHEQYNTRHEIPPVSADLRLEVRCKPEVQ